MTALAFPAGAVRQLERNDNMSAALILNVILTLGVAVMVVSPLVWAIRTAHRDHPAGTAKARLDAGHTLVRRPRRPAYAQPRAARTRPAEVWPIS
jgi:hypothetical protein